VAATPVTNPRHTVGFVVDGGLVIGGSGGYHETDVPARNILGLSGDLMVLSDGNDGALVGVPVDGDGRPGVPRRLRPGMVDHVWMDQASGTVIAQGADRRLVSRSPGDERWTPLGAARRPIMLIDGDRWVESGPDGLRFRAGDLTRNLPTRDVVTGGSLVGKALVLETLRSVRFYDAATGRRTAVLAGQGSGELSPDGSRYAGTVDGRLVLVDPRSGRELEVTGPPARAREVGWTADDTFVVVASSGIRIGSTNTLLGVPGRPPLL
jgi:hypothetical protein